MICRGHSSSCSCAKAEEHKSIPMTTKAGMRPQTRARIPIVLSLSIGFLPCAMYPRAAIETTAFATERILSLQRANEVELPSSR